MNMYMNICICIYKSCTHATPKPTVPDPRLADCHHNRGPASSLLRALPLGARPRSAGVSDVVACTCGDRALQSRACVWVSLRPHVRQRTRAQACTCSSCLPPLASDNVGAQHNKLTHDDSGGTILCKRGRGYIHIRRARCSATSGEQTLPSRLQGRGARKYGVSPGACHSETGKCEPLEQRRRKSLRARESVRARETRRARQMRQMKETERDKIDERDRER